MSNDQLSILNDHNTTNHLSHIEPSEHLRLELRYNDRREGIEKSTKASFLPTTTIRDVIKDFLKRTNLEHIRPENINLIEFNHDKRYQVPIENANMTLNALKIVDKSTLCFEPSLNSVAEEPSRLTVWQPNSTKNKEFIWYKTTTTLGMLLEQIIQTFLLESIDRERIHLFYSLEELDLMSNYDNLLRELAVRDSAFIEVEIIPPIAPSMSFMNTSTSNGLLSSLNGQSSTNTLPHTELSQRIQLELQYTNRKQNVEKNVIAQFYPTTMIRDVTKEFLKLAHLDHLRSEDVSLIEYSLDKRYKTPPDNSSKTLSQLMIVDGCTLYFESSSTLLPALSCFLTIKEKNGIREIQYAWKKSTTTLGMLLDYIIEDFSLQTMERKRIHLSTVLDKKLDHTLDSDKLLSELGIMSYECIYLKIVEPYSSSTDNRRLNIRVECAHTTGIEVFDVPCTITIEELKRRIEDQFKDHTITSLKLLNRMHYPIDMSNPTRTLSYLNVEPGETVYASLQLLVSGSQLSRLNSGSDTPTRSSSLIAKHQPDEVTVICKNSVSETTTIKASVNDSVAELIRKIEIFKKNRPSAQFEIWCRSNNIDTKQTNRRVSDFGIRAGDTINVTIVEKSPPKYALESSRMSTSSILDNLPRSQRFASSPVGLANIGNTCYMNSALQCLAHAKPLTQFFLDNLTQDVSEDDKGIASEWNQFYTIGTVIGAYADVLRNLWLPKQTSYYSNSFRPSHIKDTIGHQAPRFATYDQQDAQEFMTYLLDEIHKELKEKTGNESSTIIEELFFGKIQSTITCLECQHEVKTTNPISFLPLPLNQQGCTFTIKFIAKDGDYDFATVCVPEDGKVKSIIQAFRESRTFSSLYRTITPMANDEQLNLEMPLNQLSTRDIILIEQDEFTSSSWYDRLDRHSKKLTLEGCLREFCSLESLEDSWLCHQETCKKHTKATKQLQLCSLPPILIIQFKRFSHENGLRKKIETFVEYPTDKLDLSSFLPSPSSEEAIYDLFAVSNHTGSIYGGHYIAYARHEVNGKNEWYKFDDSYVTSFCFDSDIVSKDAYLLFYIKKDKLKQSTAVTTSLYT